MEYTFSSFRSSEIRMHINLTAIEYGGLCIYLFSWFKCVCVCVFCLLLSLVSFSILFLYFSLLNILLKFIPWKIKPNQHISPSKRMVVHFMQKDRLIKEQDMAYVNSIAHCSWLIARWNGKIECVQTNAYTLNIQIAVKVQWKLFEWKLCEQTHKL